MCNDGGSACNPSSRRARFHQQQSGDFANAGLHRHQAHQSPVQLVHRRANAARGVDRFQIDKSDMSVPLVR
jgi:hypothetical protein